jgi:hypothetical protein
MKQHVVRITCLGAVALGVFLPVFGYAALPPPRVPNNVGQKGQVLKPAPVFAESAMLENRNCCKSKGHKEKECNTCVKPLHLKNKTNIISEPGTYQVQNSMKLESGDTAILVQADDVHIDLCNKVLEGRGNDFTDPTTGIDFSGRSNVSVRNGTVQDFSTFGIFAQTVSDIIIEDISALRNGSPDVFNPPNFVPCGGILVGGTDDLGMGGTLSENVVVRRVLCDENFNWGITLPFCVNVTVSDSEFVRTRDTSFSQAAFPFSEAYNGGYFTVSTAPLASNYTFVNTKFNSAAANTRPESRFCDGFIMASNGLFTGFQGDQIADVTFIDVEFNGNLSSGDAAEAFGCALAFVRNGTFTRCTASDNVCINQTSTVTTGHASGFALYSCHGITHQDCFANNQQGIGAQVTFAAGITTVSGSDIRAVNTIANGNHADFGAAYGWQTGNFDGSSPDNHRFQWVQCVGSNNRSDTSTQPAVGFQLVGIDDALVSECEANENSFAGITVQEFVNDTSIMQNLIVENTSLVANGCYGVDDAVNSDTHLYISNIGLSNGGMNFNLQPLNVVFPFPLNNISQNEGLSPACTPL